MAIDYDNNFVQTTLQAYDGPAEDIYARVEDIRNVVYLHFEQGFPDAVVIRGILTPNDAEAYANGIIAAVSAARAYTG
jgi:hypothetical protein